VSGYELVSGYRVWADARDIERCPGWLACPICLADLGYHHAVDWQDGRDPMAGIKAAQPWKPAKT
jgi:hypothetical protein